MTAATPSIPPPPGGTADPRPPSAVSGACGLAGLAGLAAWILLARNFGAVAAALGLSGMPEKAAGPYAAMLCVLATGLPMLFWSVVVDKVHRRPSTGIDWSLKRPVADVLDISIVKLAGYWATWGLIAVFYCLCRWYWAPPYDFAMEMLAYAAVPLVALSIPYVIWLDRHVVEQRDPAWHFGAWIAGQDGWDRDQIFHHLRIWAVKGFYIAFMLSIVPGGYAELIHRDLGAALTNPVWLAAALTGAMFVVDVQFATFGYIFTARPLDSHIRSANPYLAGWVAALACYPPFILMNDGGPFSYAVNSADWTFWLRDYPALLWLWAGMLIALTAIYAWATVAFGLRFSNLTHRGILTHGPYRWTRHPAYLSKNAYWWLAGLPFLATSGSLTDMVRNTAMLALVSGIYYWRARTEEAHLMADPAYQAYAAWMDRNAPLSRLGRWLAARWPRRAGQTPAQEAAE